MVLRHAAKLDESLLLDDGTATSQSIAKAYGAVQLDMESRWGEFVKTEIVKTEAPNPPKPVAHDAAQ